MINTKKLEKLFIKYAGGEERVARIFEHIMDNGGSPAEAKAEIFRVMPTRFKLRLLSLEGQLPDRERGTWLCQSPPLSLRGNFSNGTPYTNPLKHLSKKTIRKMEARL